MKAWKLLRLRNDGTLGPLFVGRSRVIRKGEWQMAEYDLAHPGLAHRPGFHCTLSRSAPHIKLRLKNGERRVWCAVEVREVTRMVRRPVCQGGTWITADWMRVEKVYGKES